MNLKKWIDRLRRMGAETNEAKSNKSINRTIRLLEQIEEKDISTSRKAEIESAMVPILEQIQTEKDIKASLKKLRRVLMGEFGFVPPHYFVALGIGLGLALGTSLGISIGVPFEQGIIYGPMIGSGLGMLGGILIGMSLDKKKESENRVLEHL
jgi:hypothetical protein